jgi:polyhydroxyalkanoate synthesis regulator phasin
MNNKEGGQEVHQETVGQEMHQKSGAQGVFGIYQGEQNGLSERSRDGSEREHNFSVETVRNLLKIDNKGIAKLCAQISLMPKKDDKGRTYFSKDDVDILKRVKDLHEQTKNETRAHLCVPAKNIENLKKQLPQQSSKGAADRIVASISSMETNLTEKLSKLISEKLDGMDEVVVELVRCKTENETLRYKMNELNKEVYHLKNELGRFSGSGCLCQKIK